MSENPDHSRSDYNLIALGIRQPWAELILRGIKTVEVRSQATRRRGTIYLYASRQIARLDCASVMSRKHDIDVDALPKGQLVGTAEILDCRPCTPNDAMAACVPLDYLNGQYAWIIGNPNRLAEPLAVRFLPYGVWFYPFERKGKIPMRKR
ncbi:MAG: ASCH domain-containing protein [Planctomycetota bacterium]|nr:ASCH domain-containing protein [Planctomycetota bacterium]MDA1211478.1 ASCH domain-containing protein [Planctomycetota bacterium]